MWFVNDCKTCELLTIFRTFFSTCLSAENVLLEQGLALFSSSNMILILINEKCFFPSEYEELYFLPMNRRKNASFSRANHSVFPLTCHRIIRWNSWKWCCHLVSETVVDTCIIPFVFIKCTETSTRLTHLFGFSIDFFMFRRYSIYVKSRWFISTVSGDLFDCSS
jgi:hypothetical protein